MSGNYYYTVCSLPPLSFDAVPAPLVWDEFLRFCGVELPPRRLDLVARLGLLPSEEMLGRHPVLDSWLIFEGSLRNALVRLRAGGLGISGEEFSRSAYTETFSLEEAKRVVDAATPLEAEERLGRVRWQRLEALDLASEFGLGRLIAYGLKLRLLERRGRFDRKAGESVLQRATEVHPGPVGRGAQGGTA